jgi:hypothetical protein
MLERPVAELSQRADIAYRAPVRSALPEEPHTAPAFEPLGDWSVSVGLALRAAAARAGEYRSFKKVMSVLAEDHREVATALGFST